MKKLLILCAVLLSLLSTENVHANISIDNLNQCDPDSTVCSCSNDEGVGESNNIEIYSSADCALACGNLADTGSDYTSFTVTCTVGNEDAFYDSGSVTRESAIDLNTAKGAPKFDPPALNVQIPGMGPLSRATVDEANFISVNYIGEYIQGVYGWALGAGAVVAVVMFMIAGLQWMMARGNAGGIDQAKTRMQNASMGLLLLLGAYSIAFLIDPNTIAFRTLKIEQIQRNDWFPEFGEDDLFQPTDGDYAKDAIPIKAPYVNPPGEANLLHKDAVEALGNAAAEFYRETTKSIVIASAARSINKQVDLFWANCLSNPGGVCNPPTCNVSTSAVIERTGSGFKYVGELEGVTSEQEIKAALVQHGEAKRCPHTSAIGIDAWHSDGKGNYTYDPDLQYKMEVILLRNGFCRLVSEPWHFEFRSPYNGCSNTPSKSYTRKNVGTFTPPDYCAWWDGKNHKCISNK